VNYAARIGQTHEVMVEGWNVQRGQVIGRCSQNIPVNFATPQAIPPAPGSYRQVIIAKAFPNSLAGDEVTAHAATRV